MENDNLQNVEQAEAGTTTDQKTTLQAITSELPPIQTLAEYHSIIGLMVREAAITGGELSEKIIEIGESALQEEDEPYSALFTEDMTEQDKIVSAATQVIFCHYAGAKENIHEIEELDQEIVKDPIGGVYDWLFGERWIQWREQHCQREEAIQPAITNPLLQKFLPILNGNPTNVLMSLDAKSMKVNKMENSASYSKGGNAIIVHNFLENYYYLGTPTKKLVDTAILFLTVNNFYRSSNVNPTAIIPLMDYWRRQGYPVDPKDDSPKELARIKNLKKHLKRELRKYCEAIYEIEFVDIDNKSKDGKTKEKNGQLKYISMWRFLPGDRLKINFDIDFATFMVNAFQMQFPIAMLSLDNRNPNSYSICRKIVYHHSMDSNAAVGTDNTISVKSLLESAPTIPDYDTLVASGRRDWKQKIKKVLESCLDDLIDADILSAWLYRAPGKKRNITYTKETAGALSWDDYIRLMVVFTFSEEPDQTARRARRAEEKAKAAASPKKPKGKRGRPRKTAQTKETTQEG